MKKKVATIATAAILSAAFAHEASADTHTVKKGDSLFHIARAYSTTVTEIKSLNGLTTDTIYPNQKLTISQPAAPVSVPPKFQAPSSPPKSAAPTYTVVSGDSLSKIASKHQISLSSLMTWNKLSGHLIYPGQKLVVAKPATATTAQPVPAQTTKPVQTPVSVKAVPSESNSEYVIQAGDTLGLIAGKHNMTVEQLKSINQLSSDLIYAGQPLKVSGKPSPAVTTGEPPALTNDVQTLIREAENLIGTPYAWNGTTPSGFDCSGFIHYVFTKAGFDVKRTSSDGYYNRSYYVNTPQPGDLVFFENTYKKGISHLGIYVGNNEFIHADDSGVRRTSLDDSYYKKHFESFKRFY